MPAPVDLDPSAVATLLVATFVGPALASVIGPYAVIVVASLAGASWALSEETSTTTRGAVLFLLRCTLTAAVLTAGVTSVLEHYLFTPGQSRWLFAPIAFGIGWIGNDWPRVLHWAGNKISFIAERFSRGRNGK